MSAIILLTDGGGHTTFKLVSDKTFDLIKNFYDLIDNKTRNIHIPKDVAEEWDSYDEEWKNNAIIIDNEYYVHAQLDNDLALIVEGDVFFSIQELMTYIASANITISDEFHGSSY